MQVRKYIIKRQYNEYTCQKGEKDIVKVIKGKKDRQTSIQLKMHNYNNTTV